MDELQRSHRRAILSFWLLGLLNNSSFDIMLAAAETISSRGVSGVPSCTLNMTSRRTAFVLDLIDSFLLIFFLNRVVIDIELFLMKCWSLLRWR